MDEFRCACPRPDAHDCWAERYGIPDDQESVEADGGPCACGCHDGAIDDDEEEG